MISIRKAESRKDRGTKGTWYKWHLMIWLTCPDCGTSGNMSDHEVADDGTVTPSVVCPMEKTCGFHETVKLEGWVP